MDERQRRRRRNMRRVRQRNRRLALTIGLICFAVWAGMMNIKKNREEDAAQAANAKQQEASAETPKQEKKNKKKDGLVTAKKSEKKKWYLKLVNAKNPMKEDEVPEIELKTVDNNGYKVDARIYEDVKDMLADAKKDGKNLLIRSAFRQWNQQDGLYKNKIKRVMNEKGLDEEAAAVEAATVVAKPGTSEHQIGLALDIVSAKYTNLDEGQMKTDDQKWLIENCWKYGFILRYPLEKSDITGVIFEPWHYRYVGEKAAKEITEQGITLEEYLGEDAVGYPGN